VIDLSPHQLPVGTPPPPGPDGRAASAAWFFDLCRAGLQCDVVVYSAEFAGSFFGAYGKALSLADMEEASCQTRCDGLFHRPREVFLLGCNTLATKLQDRRTPAQYLQVPRSRLRPRHCRAGRRDPVRAAQPSFRESLRRIFMGVRGSTVLLRRPLGEHTAPLLEKYFRAKGLPALPREVDGDGGRNAELRRPSTDGPRPGERPHARRARGRGS
jgi:hypothetical protein